MDLILSIFGRVPLKEKVFFSRQLATMIVSGVPLIKSLNIISMQTRNSKMRSVLSQVVGDLEKGYTLSGALAKHPKVFDQVYISVVRSGEATGKIDQILLELAEQLESDQSFSSKIKSAMLYPAFILTALIAVAIMMMTRVIPQLTTVFAESKVNLPVATRALIAISNFTVHYWWAMIIGVIGLIILIRLYLMTVAGELVWNEMKIYTPVFGGLNRGIYMARFTRTLGMLVQAGVPIIEALTIVSTVMNNKIYQDILQNVATQLERGVPMSEPLSKDRRIPPIVSEMIAVGEQTGKLDQILSNLAAFYEDETETKVKGLASLLEPVIIVVIGIAVAFMVFAILMPIYQIAQIQ